MSIEGAVSRDGSLAPFRTGAARIAIASGVPIVPIFVHGGHECNPSPFNVRAGSHLHYEVLPMLLTAGLSHSDRHDVTQKLREMAECRMEASQGVLREAARRAAAQGS